MLSTLHIANIEFQVVDYLDRTPSRAIAATMSTDTAVNLRRQFLLATHQAMRFCSVVKTPKLVCAIYFSTEISLSLETTTTTTITEAKTKKNEIWSDHIGLSSSVRPFFSNLSSIVLLHILLYKKTYRKNVSFFFIFYLSCPMPCIRSILDIFRMFACSSCR